MVGERPTTTAEVDADLLYSESLQITHTGTNSQKNRTVFSRVQLTSLAACTLKNTQVWKPKANSRGENEADTEGSKQLRLR